MVPLHTLPTPIEQEHIKQALDASQTAISAIGTVVSVSTWAISVLAVIVGLIALWGWTTLKAEARAKAKQIANNTLDAYMKGDEFRELVKSRVDAAVKANWQQSLMKRLEEAVRSADDPAPFPTKEGEQ